MEINCTEETNLEFINIKQALNFNYKWVVNFDSNFNSEESPLFTNGTNNVISWCMRLERRVNLETFQGTPRNQFIFQGAVEETVYCVKLFLVPIGATKIQANCKIQLLSSIPQNTYSCKKLLQFTPGKCSECFDIKKRDVVNPQNGFLLDGKIIITCDIKAAIDISIPRSKPKCTLLNDLDRFFEDRKFTDVTLCASGTEFQAHKAVLVNRSPVFSAMFDHEMEEAKQNRVNIPDVDEKVFQELLRYIYTGKVLNLKEFAIDLLPAADKYKLQNLKILCGEEMCTSISIENAAEALVLADLHKVKQLKTVAIGFIGSHAEDVCKTDGWNSLIQSYPHLITEVLCDVSKQLHVMTS